MIYGSKNKAVMVTAEVDPNANVFQNFPLTTEAFLDMPETVIKSLNEEQLKLLAAAYESNVGGATIAVQDVVDYVTKMIGKATVCMSGLNLDNLNAACAKYAETYPKKVVEQKPEIKV